MLGLFRKDFYQMIKYQRVLMLIVVIFAAASAKNVDNAFFTVYPAVIAGLSMVTLQSYDERGGFTCYSTVMPLSKKVIVGEKYLFGAGMILLVAVMEAISFLIFHNSVLDAVRSICFITAAGLLCLSLFLPFIFALGVERGRTAYLVAMGTFCALTLLIRDQLTLFPTVTLWAALLLGAMLTALSYVISVVAYGKRSF